MTCVPEKSISWPFQIIFIVSLCILGTIIMITARFKPSIPIPIKITNLISKPNTQRILLERPTPIPLRSVEVLYNWSNQINRDC